MGRGEFLGRSVHFGNAVLSRECQWAPACTMEPQHSFFHQCLQEGQSLGVLSQTTSCLGSGWPGHSSLLTSVEGSLASPPGMACCLCQEVTLSFMGNESFCREAFSQVVEASCGFTGESRVPFPLGQWFPDGAAGKEWGCPWWGKTCSGPWPGLEGYCCCHWGWLPVCTPSTSSGALGPLIGGLVPGAHPLPEQGAGSQGSGSSKSGCSLVPLPCLLGESLCLPGWEAAWSPQGALPCTLKVGALVA